MTADVQPTYVRLDRDLHNAVKARSVEEDRTMAQTIRHALKFYLSNTAPGGGDGATAGDANRVDTLATPF